MARDLRLNISSDSTAARAGLAATAKAVDHLADETGRLETKFERVTYAAGRAGKTVLDTGKAADRAARQIDDLADETDDAARAAIKAGLAYHDLDGKLRDARGKFLSAAGAAKLLARGIDDVDDQIDQLSRSPSLPGLTAAGARFGAKAGTQAATTFSSLFEGGIIKALSNPAVAGAAAVLVAGIAVQAGATAGGAILGGAALGASALGVAGAASQSKAVGDAWSEQAERVKMQWLHASEPFIQPTIDAAREFGDVMDHVRLDKILGTSAGYFSKLVPAAGTFARYLAAGIEDLVDSAGPVIDELAKELPQLGAALKSFMQDVGDGSEGGARALGDFLDIVEGVIIGTGRFIEGASDAYDGVMRFSEGMRDLVDHLRDTNGLLYVTLAPADFFGDLLHDDADKADRFATAMSGVTHSVTEFGDAATTAFYNTADAADAMNTAFDRLFNEAFDLTSANLAVKEGLLDLRKTLEENGATLDQNTEKGQANSRALLDQVRKYEQQREAAIAAGNGTKEATAAANEAYRRNIEGLIALARQFGISEAAVRAFLLPLLSIPSQINTTITTTYRTVGGVPKGVYDPGDREDRRYGGARAGGGPVMAGVSYLVGDGGRPEVFTPAENGYISPSVADYTSRMASGWGGDGGTRTLQPISIQVDGREIVRVVMEADRRGRFQVRQRSVVP